MGTDPIVTSRIDPAVLREAARWLTRLSDSGAGPADHQALQRWLESSPQHAQAWRRAEALIADIDRLGSAPGQAAKAVLERPTSRTRRAALGRGAKLVLVPLAPVSAWMAWRHAPWDEWSADYRTAVGEQRQLDLADGTHVLLNTASAIDVRYTGELRLLRLIAGEILVKTAIDPGVAAGAAARPFVVQTDAGRMRSIGSRFAVRRFGASAFSAGMSGRCRVAVFDGAVEVSTAGGIERLERGEQVEFDAAAVAARRSVEESTEGAWTSGMLIAQRMRLADLAAELNRYRPGMLRCHPDVAELRVSGAFQLLSPDRTLRLLADTLPVRVRTLGPWWASIEPATTT